MTDGRRLPRYWATGQHFDWRNYVELEDGEFSAEEAGYIETALDELARVPEFQEMLITTQKPHIKEAWGYLLDTLNSIQNTGMSVEDFPKISIIKTGGEIAKSVGGREAEHHFLALARAIELDFNLMGRMNVRDQTGNLYTMSLQHILTHEVKHATSCEEYHLTHAVYKEKKRQINNGNANPDLTKALEAFHTLAIEIREPVIIAATNQVMRRYYNEPYRGEYGYGYITETPSNFMATLDMSDCAFPLPILSEVETNQKPLALEEIVRMLESTSTPAIAGNEGFSYVHTPQKPDKPRSRNR